MNIQVKVPEDHDSSSGTTDSKEHLDGHVRLLPPLILLYTGFPSVHGGQPACAQQILTAVRVAIDGGPVQILDDGADTKRGMAVGASASAIDGTSWQKLLLRAC